MSTISQVETNAAASAYAAGETQSKSKVSGKTIGEPKLSDKGQKYYEELKKKYSGMDFILVSEDQKEAAKSQAGNYANANRMVVLIDEDKIEKMASDENYRKQYEGIIGNAATQMPKLQSSLGATAANIKTYGMQVNDNGTASYFAVIDKSLTAQKNRIEKKAEEKKEAAKAADKKAEKATREERIKNGKTDKTDGAGKTDQTDAAGGTGDTVTVTASSMEELVQKINDLVYAGMSDAVQTTAEKQVGQSIDFSV